MVANRKRTIVLSIVPPPVPAGTNPWPSTVAAPSMVAAQSAAARSPSYNHPHIAEDGVRKPRKGARGLSRSGVGCGETIVQPTLRSDLSREDLSRIYHAAFRTQLDRIIIKQAATPMFRRRARSRESHLRTIFHDAGAVPSPAPS